MSVSCLSAKIAFKYHPILRLWWLFTELDSLPPKPVVCRQCLGSLQSGSNCHSNNHWHRKVIDLHCECTIAHMVFLHFRSVHAEPSSCRLVQSDHTSRTRLCPTAVQSRPSSVLELVSVQDSGQTRFLQRCLSSPGLLREHGSMR